MGKYPIYHIFKFSGKSKTHTEYYEKYDKNSHQILKKHSKIASFSFGWIKNLPDFLIILSSFSHFIGFFRVNFFYENINFEKNK